MRSAAYLVQAIPLSLHGSAFSEDGRWGSHLPEGHGVQKMAPTVILRCPSGHGSFLLPSHWWPMGQMMQLELVSPSVQFVQPGT